MKINAQTTDDVLLQLIGERLAEVRLSRNLTQLQVAEQAGLGVRTVQRLETGASATQLSGFLRVCRVLGLTEQLEALIPPPKPSPMAQLKHQRPVRQRATGRRATKQPPAKPWTWDDSV